jgi:hypothetical protein
MLTSRTQALAELLMGAVLPLPGQTVQYRSPAGVEYRSLRDTGAVARAERALAADPRNIDLIIALGVAQSGRSSSARRSRPSRAAGDRARQRDALPLARAPPLSVREFDRAMADLTCGYGLDSLNYGSSILGVLRFARRLQRRADAFRRGSRCHRTPELAGPPTGSGCR